MHSTVVVSTHALDPEGATDPFSADPGHSLKNKGLSRVLLYPHFPQSILDHKLNIPRGDVIHRTDDRNTSFSNQGSTLLTDGFDDTQDIFPSDSIRNRSKVRGG